MYLSGRSPGAVGAPANEQADSTPPTLLNASGGHAASVSLHAVKMFICDFPRFELPCLLALPCGWASRLRRGGGRRTL